MEKLENLNQSVEEKKSFLKEIHYETTKLSNITYNQLMNIAQDIRNNEINWKWKEGTSYWLITITPEGEILVPDKEDIGHPQLAKNRIYPKDKVLKELFEYYCWRGKDGLKKEMLDSTVIMSYFMIYYGYINIDGMREYLADENEEERIIMKVNKKALTPETTLIEGQIENFINNKETDLVIAGKVKNDDGNGIRLATIVPLLRKEIKEYLKLKEIDENDIEKVYSAKGRKNRKLRLKFWEWIDEKYDEIYKEINVKTQR